MSSDTKNPNIKAKGASIKGRRQMNAAKRKINFLSGSEAFFIITMNFFYKIQKIKLQYVMIICYLILLNVIV